MTTVKLTKKLIRESRNGILLRINQLSVMSIEKLQEEVTRCLPGIKVSVTETNKVDVLKWLICDCITLALPDQWLM